MTEEATTVRCSFCGKSQDEARTIIAGPNVHICDECVDLCKKSSLPGHRQLSIHCGWLGVRCGRVSRGDLFPAQEPERSNHHTKAEQRYPCSFHLQDREGLDRP